MSLTDDLRRLLDSQNPSPRAEPAEVAQHSAPKGSARSACSAPTESKAQEAQPDRAEWKPARGSSPWARDAALVIRDLCRSLEDWYMLEAARSEAGGMSRRDAERAAFGALIFQILVGVDVKTATQRDNHKEPAP